MVSSGFCGMLKCYHSYQANMLIAAQENSGTSLLRGCGRLRGLVVPVSGLGV